MSDENRSESGQFTPSTEGTSGEEYLNRAAGYVPFKEEPKTEAGEGAQDIADSIADIRAQSAPEAEIKTYSETFDNLPDNASITTKQLGELFAEHRESAEEQIEAAEVEATKEWQDGLLGDQKPAEAEDIPMDAAPDLTEAGREALAESDDAAIERALKIPKLKAALTEVNERFTQSVNVAHTFALASLGDYPEIMSLPPEQREGALVAMAQREPERFDRFMGAFSRAAQLDAAKQQQQQQAEQQRQAELSEYARAESAKFEASIKDVPKAERAAIEANIAEAITEYGADIGEFVKLMQTSEFASSTVQSLLWEVGKYRQIMKAKASVPTRHVPTVQRPGVSGPRVESGSYSEAIGRHRSDPSTKGLAGLIAAARRG
jgi:hypothetical protein